MEEESKNIDINKKEKKVKKPKKLSPKEQVVKLETDILGHEDKYLRLQAEYQNYRKRTSKDILNTRILGQIDALEPVLTVYDHFNMAVKATENADNIDAIKHGLSMIATEFSNAMTDIGVETINAVGKEFDPNLHEAMANEASEDIEENFIIKQWSNGYKMGERLLRPAKVVVSTGPVNEEENQQSEDKKD